MAGTQANGNDKQWHRFRDRLFDYAKDAAGSGMTRGDLERELREQYRDLWVPLHGEREDAEKTLRQLLDATF